jgi:hypothetical protein
LLFTKYTIKSGTKAHPRPIATHIAWTVTTKPIANQRPNVVKTYTFRIQGVRENTNDFAICASSRLIDPKEGPSTCLKHSKIGSGFLIEDHGPTSRTDAAYNPACRLEITIYNSGNHNLTLYMFKGKQKHGQPRPCALAKPVAVTVFLTKIGNSLRGSFTMPPLLRHPVTTAHAGQQSAGVTAGSLTIPIHTTVIHPIVKGKTVNRRVALLESTFCPANHLRQTAMTFKQEDGTKRTATRAHFCKY